MKRFLGLKTCFFSLRYSKSFLLAFLFLLYSWAFVPYSANAKPSQPKKTPEIILISDWIFQNECSAKTENLLSWNDGEGFPSLGIGHFIWYPKHFRGRFVESFPEFLQFAQSKGKKLPPWFSTLKGMHAPWKNKRAFMKAQRKGKLRELQNFLDQTKDLQTLFMVERLKETIPEMIHTVPEITRTSLQKKLSILIRSKHGLYLLIDYVNFKGEGLTASERYHQQGWGLLQVLETMRTPKSPKTAAIEFKKSAEKVLRLRIKNSPAERGEVRWLPGWLNRVKTYTARPEPHIKMIKNFILRKKLLQKLRRNNLKLVALRAEQIRLKDIDDKFPLVSAPKTA